MRTKTYYIERTPQQRNCVSISVRAIEHPVSISSHENHPSSEQKDFMSEKIDTLFALIIISKKQYVEGVTYKSTNDETF